MDSMRLIKGEREKLEMLPTSARGQTKNAEGARRLADLQLLNFQGLAQYRAVHCWKWG